MSTTTTTPFHNNSNSNSNSANSNRNNNSRNGITGRVRIELYASKLKNVAGAFKGTSDPYAVVTLLPNHPTEKPRVIGTTEVIKNTLNPRWTKFFELDYSIGQLTRINVGIYDEIRKAKTNKPMGSAMFEIGEVLGSRGNLKAKNLRDQKGILFCRITAAPPTTTHSNVGSSSSSSYSSPSKPITTISNAGTLQLGLRGIRLKNVDGLFSKSDPFLEISMAVNVPGALTWQPIYRSKHVLNNLNPIWPLFSIDLNRLLTADDVAAHKDVTLHPLLIQVYDWEKSGKHVLIGQFETTVQALLRARSPGGSGPHKSVDTTKAFTLQQARHPRKEFGKILVTTALIEGATTPATMTTPSTSSSATASTTSTNVSMTAAIRPTPAALYGSSNNNNNNNNHNFSVSNTTSTTTAPTRPSFLDYITGGCELELSIAIDFTGSNGDPRRPGTLHYIHPNGHDLNDYEKAFLGVGSIVAKYDSNQYFPVYGFGAKLFGNGQINHCFQVGDQPELHGLGEALQAYRRVFQTGLTMSGPTVLAEVIDLAAARARSAQDEAARIGQQRYGILLILTDGAVTDIPLTQQALRNASSAPLSIVIVGVGNANFDRMQFLDDAAHGDPQQQQRDICQFVAFSQYAHDKSALTRETLAEIPDQLVDYFYTTCGILPLPPMGASQLLNVVLADDPTDEDIDLTIEYNNDNDEEIVLGDTTTLPQYDDSQYPSASVYLVPPVPVPATAAAAATSMAAVHSHGAAASSSSSPSSSYYQASASTTTPMASSSSSSYPMATAVPIPITPPPTPTAPIRAPPTLPSSPPPAAPTRRNDVPAFSQALNVPSPSSHVPPPSSLSSSSSSAAPSVFHVQVPPGVSPGEQLEIQHPRTGRYQIVTIPPGVRPGGQFAVSL
ncbi:hypothetical protein ACA910_006607 [Epithemia clementina (nom. ined.)]